MRHSTGEASLDRHDSLTSLDLSGSPALTDDGLRDLARLPALTHLNLSGCRAITDRGLEVLRHLPSLQSLSLAWTACSDVGAAHLAACRNLRSVDLMGTPSGDGAIRALAGIETLRDFRSGNGVTTDGIRLLRDIPVYGLWLGGDVHMELCGFDAEPNYLLLRGPFGDTGLEQLAGLEGLFALNVDDTRLGLTANGLAPLTALPHLGWLAFDAHDDGFAALSRSRTIEYIWARRCHNLHRRGFEALSTMPALRGLSASCLNVDDEGLASLPRFPALTELMPMDVPDGGYRHIGRCERLESLVLMYCRETGDEATSHITGLSGLRSYFASYNRITDRTPRLLSTMASLERVTFDTCLDVTNAGVEALAHLPRLRDLRVSGMPGVTSEIAAAFGPDVRVSWHA